MSCNAYNVFFKNLASPVKTQLLRALKEKPKSVNELVKELKLEQSKISHALANMKYCSIVSVEQKGKQRIYSLNKKTIVPILKIIDEHAMINCKDCKE